MAAPVSYVWRHYGFHSAVRDKTFSAHVMAQIRRVVSKSGLFTHERITVSVSRVTPKPAGKRLRSYVLMHVCPFHAFALRKSAGRGHAQAKV